MGVKDKYYAKRKIVAAHKKMIRGAPAENRKAAIDKHLRETEGQTVRLMFEILGGPARTTAKARPKSPIDVLGPNQRAPSR